MINIPHCIQKTMPKFILYIATTLDGYIASLDGSIEWLISFETNGDNGYTKFYRTVDALIMGSTTYEQIVGFGDWVYSGKLTYVLTSRNLTSDRSDVVFIKGGIEAVLQALQHKNYGRIWVVGGGKVASSFMAQELIDEFILTVMPIILGKGISLYQSVPEQKLKLIGTTSYKSGAVELHYQKC